MRTLQITAAAFLLVLLASCESPGHASIPAHDARPRYAAGGASPFAGAAPPSAAYVPRDRYYAFGGGYSDARRQTEGDDNNFLHFNDHCHRRCGYRGYCGYGYGSWGNSCYYRPRCGW